MSVGFLLALVGCASTLPRWEAVPSSSAAAEQGLALVERSVEAHGGDLYESVEDLSVRYDGTWGKVAVRVQPELTDSEYRKSSEERLILEPGIIAQLHTGPTADKRKKVYRDRTGASVFYSGEKTPDEDQAKASALVADVYRMLILAPSYFLHTGNELLPLDTQRENGRVYDRVVTRLEPGLGFSASDRVVLWIDQETGRLFRLHFSLEGYPGTQGADVDITFSNHREIEGFLWPTHFRERIRAPIRAFAHQWNLLGLDLNRGLTAKDLEGDGPYRGAAVAPARDLP
ncbi:MAG: hypothetical protein SX243_09420 [Acidobacteriota bacterium]|nr:hypothetical protein [Acidobacteriota bacterium]